MWSMHDSSQESVNSVHLLCMPTVDTVTRGVCILMILGLVWEREPYFASLTSHNREFVQFGLLGHAESKSTPWKHCVIRSKTWPADLCLRFMVCCSASGELVSAAAQVCVVHKTGDQLHWWTVITSAPSVVLCEFNWWYKIWCALVLFMPTVWPSLCQCIFTAISGKQLPAYNSMAQLR